MSIYYTFLSLPGGHSGGETPVPIPNTEVKPSSADGTAWVTAWESRSLPGFIFQPSFLLKRGLLVFGDKVSVYTPCQNFCPG